MQFPCARCGRTYEIADELCVGRAVKVACPACGNLAVHRVPAAGAAPAPAAPAPRPPPGTPSAFAEADDADFDNALSALEAPAGSGVPLGGPEEDEAELADLPEPEPLPPPATGARPPGPPAGAAKAPAPRPPPPPPLDEEEPVLVEAELVIRRSARRARVTAAVVAAVAITAILVGGGFALKMKKSGSLAGGERRRDAGPGGEASSALSEADLARLMGKKPPEPVPERPIAKAPAADRPKHDRLALKDRELLDLLAKKGDASVTVQEDDVAALATSRGSLDEQAIEGTLNRSASSFAACVSRAIAASPDQRLPATKVNLELTVRPSGRVQKAAVQEAAIARLPLGQCIAAAAKRMVFPGFDGEPIDIVVPLKLKVGL